MTTTSVRPTSALPVAPSVPLQTMFSEHHTPEMQELDEALAEIDHFIKLCARRQGGHYGASELHRRGARAILAVANGDLAFTVGAVQGRRWTGFTRR